MPASDETGTQYFFDVITDAGVNSDPEGAFFANFDAARREAVLVVKDLVAEELRHGGGLREGRFLQIREATGNISESIAFGDALRDSPGYR